jgi:hypothetical protein
VGRSNIGFQNKDTSPFEYLTCPSSSFPKAFRGADAQWNCSVPKAIFEGAMTTLYPLAALLICVGYIPASAQQTSSTDSEHFRSVDKRGDTAMGFSHEMTSHHFLLFKDGGAIEVEADNPNDAASKEAIRDHLTKIAGMFSEGDFQLPMLIHATVPPGVDTMQRLKNEITYTAEITEKGARVRIRTGNSQALEAIHEFLRFQITDHRTQDSIEVQQ